MTEREKLTLRRVDALGRTYCIDATDEQIRAAGYVPAAELASVWDEGWSAYREYTYSGTADRPTNPYRLPKGPTK